MLMIWWTYCNSWYRASLAAGDLLFNMLWSLMIFGVLLSEDNGKMSASLGPKNLLPVNGVSHPFGATWKLSWIDVKLWHDWN